MIVPDINLLVYAHDEAAPLHRAARTWWEGLIDNEQAVALPWAIIIGFVRLVTHASVMKEPLQPLEALERVREWMDQPAVQILEPGPAHLGIVRRLFEATGVAASLTTDTHLAALAIEYQCELHSNDGDFARFPGLRWRNPLS